MKIVICGSMAFAKQMMSVKDQLEEAGHKVDVPDLVNEFIQIKELEMRAKKGGGSEGAKLKKKYNLIKGHYEKIKKADAILVLNYDKNKIKNYIGGNSFLEMGFAHILDKKIFLLNPIPSFKFYREEILAMEPVVLNNNLSKIK